MFDCMIACRFLIKSPWFTAEFVMGPVLLNFLCYVVFFFFFFLILSSSCALCPMVPVSLDCPFLSALRFSLTFILTNAESHLKCWEYNVYRIYLVIYIFFWNIENKQTKSSVWYKRSKNLSGTCSMKRSHHLFNSNKWPCTREKKNAW